MLEEVKGYNEFGSVDVRIDETWYAVQEHSGNWISNLLDQWVLDGNTIPPYVAPEE